MEKLTKIVATIGPSCDSEKQIEALINAGVNVFRFNFKHNILEWHNDRIQRVNIVSEKMGMTIGTLIDLQGPEIRINMSSDQIILRDDDLLSFGEGKDLSISHPQIIRHLTIGQKISADSGSFSFTVEKKGNKTYLRSHQKAS